MGIVAVVSFCVYLRALGCDFVVDDRHLILANPWITDVKYIPLILTKSVWSFQGLENLSNHYRPLYLIYYLVTYHIFGYAAWGFHLVNNIFHMLSSIFVFLIALKLIGGRHGEEREWASKARLGALFTALVFATHPVNTESVVWVAAISELSFALFSFISIYLYISSERVGSLRYWGAVIFFFIGALSKETAAFVPPLLVCYDLLIRREPVRPIKAWIVRYLPFVFVGIVYLVMRFQALGGITPMSNEPDLAEGDIVLNFFPLVHAYIGKLYRPVNLIFYEYLDVVTGLTDPRLLGSLVVIFSVIYFAVVLRKRNSVALFALLWIFIPLIPVFHMSMLKGHPALAERYLYISTAGFGLLLALGYLYYAESSAGAKKFLTAFFIGLILLYSYGTIHRTGAWKNELTLWQDSTSKAPDNKYAFNNLAIELTRRGRIYEGIVAFRRSLEIDPGHNPARNNLGIALAKTGDIEGAVREFQTVLADNPNDINARKNLQQALSILGKD